MSETLKRIKQAQKGDREAFVKIIKNDEQKLYHTAFKILGNEYDTNDVLQETILAAYQNISKLKKAKYFHTWLYRILINQCNKYLKEKNSYKSLLDSYQLSNKEQGPFHSIQYYVDGLDGKYKIPLLLYYQDGFTIKEIAEILGEPEGTIKSKLSRGRAMIKREYEYNQEELSNERD
jgi:RNA polymerase sigma factor (sigma-70 family)